MKSDKVYLAHIIEEIDFLNKQTATMDYHQFLQDDVLTRACTRSLEIIGEATKNLSADFRKKQSHVEWKQLAGMRDKLIHGYFGINWMIVWDVIRNKLPELKHQIEIILEIELL